MFTHALIQETLTEELSLTRRVRLHASIAETLEELYGDYAEAHATELAQHFGEAEAVLGTEKLVEYSVLAGERGLATYAFEEASEHFQRALTAKEGQPLDGVMASIYAGLGRARVATAQRHQIRDALSNLEIAFDYFVENGDVTRAVAVAECPLPNFVGLLEGASERVARALELVPPDSLQAGRLLSRYGRLIGIEKNDYASAKEAFQQALLIAQKEGDKTLEMQVLAKFAYVAQFQIQIEEVLEHSLKAIELAQQVNDPHAELEVRTAAGISYYRMGQPEQSHLHLSTALAVAERLRDRFWLGGTLYRSQLLALALGDWPAAHDFGNRGLLVDETDPRILAASARLEYEEGGFDLGETYLSRILEASQLSLMANASVIALVPIAYRITGNAFQIDYVESAAQAFLSSPYIIPAFQRDAHLGLGLLAAQRGDSHLAADRYSALEPYRDTISIFGLSFDRVLGLLAHTMGDLDLAVTHFEECFTFCRNAGYRPELAWTCCDFADTLLQRNEAGDREKAMSLLDESLAISNELGMRPLMERVISRRDVLKA